MATVTHNVTAPDGSILHIEGPEDADPAAIVKYAQDFAYPQYLSEQQAKAKQPEDKYPKLAAVADAPLSVGRGVVGGIQMIADAFGANNPVSKTLSSVDTYLADLMSAQSKKDSQEIARIMNDAKDKGVWDQVKAGVQALGVAPVDLTLNAFGYAAPTVIAGLVAMFAAPEVAAGATVAEIASALATRKALATGAEIGIGAISGAGTIKNRIYGDVYQALKDQQVPEEKAVAAAEQAQAYNGKNLDQILLGTLFGAGASVSGAEATLVKSMASKILKNTAETAATEAEKHVAKGIGGRFIEGAVKEAIPEAAQESQEQVASNVALQREGMDVPTFRGAASSAALAGSMGAIMGGGLDVALGQGPRTVDKNAENEALLNDLRTHQADLAASRETLRLEDMTGNQILSMAEKFRDRVPALGEILDSSVPRDVKLELVSNKLREANLANVENETINLKGVLSLPSPEIKKSENIRQVFNNALDIADKAGIPLGDLTINQGPEGYRLVSPDGQVMSDPMPKGTEREANIVLEGLRRTHDARQTEAYRAASDEYRQEFDQTMARVTAAAAREATTPLNPISMSDIQGISPDLANRIREGRRQSPTNMTNAEIEGPVTFDEMRVRGASREMLTDLAKDQQPYTAGTGKIVPDIEQELLASRPSKPVPTARTEEELARQKYATVTPVGSEEADTEFSRSKKKNQENIDDRDIFQQNGTTELGYEAGRQLKKREGTAPYKPARPEREAYPEIPAAPRPSDEEIAQARQRIEDRIAKLEAAGKQGEAIGKGVRDAVANSNFTPEQLVNAFQIADISARLLGKTDADPHALEFVQRIAKTTGETAGGARIAPRENFQGVIRMSLDPQYHANANSTSAHESFHVLQDLFAAYDKAGATVINNAFKGAKSFDDIDANLLRKLKSLRDPDTRKSVYDTLKEHVPQEVLDGYDQATREREMQAYVFGYMDNAITNGNQNMGGLGAAFVRFLNYFRQFKERVANYYKGLGYNTAEDVIAATSRSERQAGLGVAGERVEKALPGVAFDFSRARRDGGRDFVNKDVPIAPGKAPIPEGHIENHSSAIAEAMQNHFGVPVSVSKSKTAYGESHYVQPKFNIPRDEVPFSIRISDHGAWVPRLHKIEHQVYPKKEDNPEKFIDESIDAAKKYGQRIGIFPKDEFVPLKGEVYHPTFGKGTIVNSQLDSAKVDFGDKGVKNISSRFLQEVGHRDTILSSEFSTARIRQGKENLSKYGIPKGEKGVKTRRLAEALEARQRAKYGTIERNDYSPEAAKKISNWIADEVKFAVDQQADGTDAGVGWYSEKYQRALDAFSGIFPELKTDKIKRDLFTAVVALMSDGQKVYNNFSLAGRAYSEYRDTGRFPEVFKFGGERVVSMENNLKNLNDLIAKFGEEGTAKYLMETKTVSELAKIAKADGLNFSTSYKADVRLPMAALVFGPKLGAFYANLMGSHGYLTMDRWWSRTFNRYRGQLVTRIIGTADRPFNSKGEPIGLARFKELLAKYDKRNSPWSDMSDREAIARLQDFRDAYAVKGYKNGTEIEKAANTLYKAVFEGTEDQPFNASDRTFMIHTTNRARQLLKRRGIDLSLADIQAVLWYYEKRLYGELGARQTADISYEEAANRVVSDHRDQPGRWDTHDAPETTVVGPDGSLIEVGDESADVGAEPEEEVEYSRASNFDKYSEGVKTLGPDGKPLTVYRGQRMSDRFPTKFDTTKGRSSPSFASDPEVANVYAGKRDLFPFRPQVGKYYMGMKNPLDIRDLGDVVSMNDFFSKIPHSFTEAETVGNVIGYDQIAEAIRSLDKLAANNSAYFDLGGVESAADYPGPVFDFDTLADFIQDQGINGEEQLIQKGLGAAKVDSYLLADSSKIKSLLTKAGYDGIIHKDAFDAGARRYQGDTSKLEQGSMGPVIDAYRPFKMGAVKSATGNRGTYDRKNPNPLFSRAIAATKQEKEAEDNSKRHFQVWDKAREFFNPLALVNNLPQLLSFRNIVTGSVTTSEQYARKMADKIAKGSVEERQAVYTYMTTKAGDASLIKDPEIRKAAIEAKKAINNYAKIMVERGEMTQESFDMYYDRYLPRIYLLYEATNRGMKTPMGGTSIREYLDKRDEKLSEDYRKVLGEIKDPSYLTYVALSRPARDMAMIDYLNNLFVYGGDPKNQWIAPQSYVKFARPGETEKTAKSYTPYMLQNMADDLDSVAKLTEELSPDQAAAMRKEALRMRDAAMEPQKELEYQLNAFRARGYEQIPARRQYGAMAGAVVQKGIYQDLVGTFIPVGKENRSLIERILGDEHSTLGKATLLWKLGKTTLNPPTQVVNFVSNAIALNLFGGVPVHKFPDLFSRTLKEIMNNGKMWQEAQKFGISGGTMSKAELDRAFIRLKRYQAKAGGEGNLANMYATSRAIGSAFIEKAGDAYQFSESLFKMMMYIHSVEDQKMKPSDAVNAANDVLFDYSLVNNNIRWLRNAPLGLPFITYYYKALPKLIETLYKHPERFIPYFAMAYALPAMTMAAFDLNDDELEKLRKSTQDYVRDSGTMFFLPIRDSKGNIEFVDLGKYLPFSTFLSPFITAFKYGEYAKGAKELIQPITPSGPIVTVIEALGTGKDPFTGKPIMDPRDTNKAQALSMFSYIWNQAMPPIVGMDFNNPEKSSGALPRIYNSLFVDGTGVDKRGMPKPEALESAARLLGLNITPLKADVQRIQNINYMMNEINKTKALQAQIAKDQSLKPVDRTARIRELNEKIKDQVAEMQKYANETANIGQITQKIREAK